MTFGDLIGETGVIVPLEASDLAAAVFELVERRAGSQGASLEGLTDLATGLACGTYGEQRLADDETLVLVGQFHGVDEVVAAIGVGRVLSPERSGEDDRGPITALVVLLTPRRLAALEQRFLPSLVRQLRDQRLRRRLRRATTEADVRALRGLMGIPFKEEPLVEDALTPLQYRIYPDTPVEEVIDLMVRRELRTIPVVGENLEMLGVISVGDALRYLLPRGRSEDEGRVGEAMGDKPFTARDVMTRTVMCISEDLTLREAASQMVNRDVEQLPVVREGELIGSLTRYEILKRLFGD